MISLACWRVLAGMWQFGKPTSKTTVPRKRVFSPIKVENEGLSRFPTKNVRHLVVTVIVGGCKTNLYVNFGKASEKGNCF